MQNNRPAPDPRTEKLPRWAQDYIDKLERYATFAERQHAELRDSQEQTRITHGDHYDNPRYLPNNDTIRFHSADDDTDWIEVGFDRKQANSGIKGAQIIVRGSDSLKLMPGVTAVVGIASNR